jgi:hypothetical protein
MMQDICAEPICEDDKGPGTNRKVYFGVYADLRSGAAMLSRAMFVHTAYTHTIDQPRRPPLCCVVCRRYGVVYADYCTEYLQTIYAFNNSSRPVPNDASAGRPSGARPRATEHSGICQALPLPSPESAAEWPQSRFIFGDW